MTTAKKNGQSKELEAVEQILMKTSHTVHSAALYSARMTTRLFVQVKNLQTINVIFAQRGKEQ
jgi:hypothetical protein